MQCNARHTFDVARRVLLQTSTEVPKAVAWWPERSWVFQGGRAGVYVLCWRFRLVLGVSASNTVMSCHACVYGTWPDIGDGVIARNEI